MYTFKPRFLLIVLITCSAILSACGSSAPVIRPFKMDIQQGNVVTSKMLLQLRPGMTKSQVKFVMGSPLIIDSFHLNRWDYFYQLRQAGKVVEQRRVILDFEKELLARVRGDVVPQGTNSDAVGLSNESNSNGSSAPSKRVEKEGVFENLKFWNRNDATPEKPAVKPAAKKSTSEKKGLLNSLKFWQKDDKPAVKKPVAPAKAEKIDLKELEKPVLPNIKNQAESETTDAPAVNAPQATPMINKPNEQLPIEAEPFKIGPVNERAPITFIDLAPSSTEIAEPKPSKTLPESLKPVINKENPVLKIEQDERQLLKFYKELNNAPNSNIVKPDRQTDTQLKETPINAQPKKTVLPKIELQKTEPAIIEQDMFDRILEKIGF